MRAFVMSLIIAGASCGIAEGIISSTGELKKYLRYLCALTILLTLMSPLKNIISAIPEYIESGKDVFDYSSVEAVSRVNSLIGLHIRDSVAEKFGIESDDISAIIYDGVLRLELKKQFGIFKSDIEDYVKSNFSLECEVIYIE